MQKKAFLISVKIIALLMLSLVIMTGCDRGRRGEWPSRPIQVFIGANPGGGADVTGRITINVLSRHLGATLVPVNMPGAGGGIAIRHVRDAAPNGYSVKWFHDGMLTHEVSGVIDFGFEDFRTAGIALLGNNTTFVTSNRFQTFDEFVSYARANPGTLRYGVEMGIYHGPFVATMMRYLGISIQMIDTGPLAPSIAAMHGGHIDMTAGPIGLLNPHIEAGVFVPHGVLARERDMYYPDIPTMIELGVNFHRPQFFSFWFPLGTPDEIVNRFSEALERTVADQEFIDAMYIQRFTPVFMPPQEAVEFMTVARADITQFQRILDEYEASR